MSAVASAEDVPLPPRALSPDEQARELYLRGDRLYAEGSYDEAIKAFGRALELSQRPVLLYNMANALERLGRYTEAIRCLNEYAPRAPEHHRPLVESRIEALINLTAPPQKEQTADNRESSPPSTEHLDGSAETSLAAADDPGRRAPVLGYAIGGAGMIGLGLGVALGLSAADARNDAESRCLSDGEDVRCPVSARAALSDQKLRATAADVAWALGAVGVGVGLYLMLATDSESGSTTRLGASATRSGGMIGVVAAF